MNNKKLIRKHLVTIRLNDYEYFEVVERCKRLNISISDYFRLVSLSFITGGGFCADK